jgi:CheY-like chemotaxis protein
MSGLDLQQRLRREGSTIPVMIITAFDDDRSREQAERLGCVAYLRSRVKPKRFSRCSIAWPTRTPLGLKSDFHRYQD